MRASIFLHLQRHVLCLIPLPTATEKVLVVYYLHYNVEVTSERKDSRRVWDSPMVHVNGLSWKLVAKVVSWPSIEEREKVGDWERGRRRGEKKEFDLFTYLIIIPKKQEILGISNPTIWVKKYNHMRYGGTYPFIKILWHWLRFLVRQGWMCSTSNPRLMHAHVDPLGRLV